MAQKGKQNSRSPRRFVRYEFPVPKRYNDKKTVEKVKFQCLEVLLIEFFEGYSQFAGSGGWSIYPDEQHIKYQVDVPDNQFNRRFFHYFRRVLERWFRQERIWMTRSRIDLV